MMRAMKICFRCCITLTVGATEGAIKGNHQCTLFIEQEPADKFELLADVYDGVNRNYGESQTLARQFMLRLLEYRQNKN